MMAMKGWRRKFLKPVGFALLLGLISAGCGGGGGGGTSGPASSDLLGNFKLVYTLGQLWTDLLVIDTKSSGKTREGTDFYTGYDANYDFIAVAGAWYPSLSKFVVAESTVYVAGTGDVGNAYSFVIEGDNRLTGCFYLYVNGSSSRCYDLDPSQSHKYPAGKWARSARVQAKGLPDFRHKLDQLLGERSALSRTPADADPNMEKAVAELTKAVLANRP